jgi:hypothetical protein
VLFADRAELLACLTADVCAGRESARWWWRGLFPRRDLARELVALWQESPEYAPGALQHLARAGRLQAFARRLSGEEARRLTEHVVRRFALDGLHAAVREAGPCEADGRALVHSSVESSARLRDEPRAPWAGYVPESEAPGLGVEQRCLLGVGLTLRRAPQVARSHAFAAEVRLWRASAARRGDTPRAPHSQTFDAHDALRASPRAAATRDTEGPRQAEEVFIRPAGRESSDDETPPTRSAPPSPPNTSPHAREADDVRVTSDGAARDSSFDVEREFRSEPAHAPEASHAPTNTPPRVARDVPGGGADAGLLFETVEEAAPLEASFETRLGGLFFLLNLGLYLNLYGDFSAPAEPGLPLSVWDFVTLLGRELLRAGGGVEALAAYKDDPVWPFLARLAGRDESVEPGESFVPPDDWRVPAEWLARTPARGRWLRLRSDERLRVLHPEGFLVLDVRLDGADAGARAEEELSKYESPSGREVAEVGREEFFALAAAEHDVESLTLSSDGGVRDSTLPLRRWLGLLMGYVRVRLRLALGLAEARDIARVLCERRASVALTATHLDATFGLAELPIELRLCGLDRDPGWIPAAGRVVTFHFS